MQSLREQQAEIRKSSLREQCKEIEENNRMRKTRNFFKNIGDIKGTFSTRMGMIKDRNSKDLQKQKRLRSGKITQKNCTSKVLMTSTNHDGVVTHLQPHILQCEVKWDLGSITINKASGGDGIPAELFQILKEDAVKVLHSICQQIWITQKWPQYWTKSVFILIPKKGNAKECSNQCTIDIISLTGNVMLKILSS